MDPRLADHACRLAADPRLGPGQRRALIDSVRHWLATDGRPEGVPYAPPLDERPPKLVEPHPPSNEPVPYAPPLPPLSR